MVVPRSYKVLLATALILAAGSFTVTALLYRSVTKTTTRTNDALCTFRADVEQRAEGTRKFLAEHPEGIPGIPVATLRQSLDAQRRTVKALSTLDCPSRP